jgi:hypothetical protein
LASLHGSRWTCWRSGMARAKVSALLPLINAVAKAHISGFEPIELGQCVDWIRSDGRLRRRLSDTVTLHVRSNHRITAPDQAAAVDMQIKNWMALARGDQDVADVLRLWGSMRMQDWNTLSNIKEKIEARVGSQMVRLGWATRSELRLFDQTANSPAVLEDAARHGVQRTDPPATPMKIGQAQELVKHLIDGWIERLRTNI